MPMELEPYIQPKKDSDQSIGRTTQANSVTELESPVVTEEISSLLNENVIETLAPQKKRSTVLILSIKEKLALLAAYMPFLKNGGIFIPTDKSYQLGEEVYAMLTLLDDNQKYPVVGHVAWINYPNSLNGKMQGIGIHFGTDEASMKARKRIEEMMKGLGQTAISSHTF